MKKILTIFTALVFGMSLYAIDIFNYVPVSSSVKSYTQTEYTITSKFGDLFRTPNLKIVHNFDDAGNEAEIVEISAKDVLMNKTVCSYDKDNNLVEQNCYDQNSELLWKNIYSYKDGKKSDMSEYNKDGELKGKIIYIYSDGNLVDETGYDAEGVLVWKTIYKYTDGVLTTASQYSADGALDTEITYAYTAEGKAESITTEDGITKLSTQKVFRYASNGNLTEVTTYDSNKQITNRLMIKYDNSGNIARLSGYNISNKFGSVQNELSSMSEFVYSNEVTDYEAAANKARYVDAK